VLTFLEERSIQEIKGFARSFENSLPYVMSRTILTFCVLYCVSTMNLMIPTNGTLQVSPMEQFTGRKLDMKRDLSFGFGDMSRPLYLTPIILCRPVPKDALLYSRKGTSLAAVLAQSAPETSSRYSLSLT
jgi:hypothetical protein